MEQISEITHIPENISFSYKCEIKNFRKLRSSERIESPIFSNGTNSEIKWHLKIVKFEGGEDYMYDMKLKLISSDLTIKSVSANCKFQLLGPIIVVNEYETWQRPFQLEFEPGKYADCCTMYETEFLRRIGCRDTNIIVKCDIEVQKIGKLMVMPNCTMADTFERELFENKKFSDVTFCVSGMEFDAHKAILAARSPVFNAMFEHAMEEKQTNRVNIPDIDPDVFYELLRYIYTGKVFNLDCLASDLLSAAEKYDFDRLKMICGKALCENITIENAAEIYVLTDMYNLEQPKAMVRRYIGGHAKDVIKTAGWNLITQSHRSLVTEILGDLTEQIHDKIVIE